MLVTAMATLPAIHLETEIATGSETAKDSA
jgi:hypothetical protein